MIISDRFVETYTFGSYVARPILVVRSGQPAGGSLMQDDPLRGNVHKARAIRNPVRDRLDAIIPIFGDEIANPFVIIAIEYL